MNAARPLGSSFRDPSGFLFVGADGRLYRQVNRKYQANFELLGGSGLYDELASKGLLIDHEVASEVSPLSDDGFCVLRPRRLSFISYPYEWAFSALQDAALATLEIQIRAMNRGLQLKDATAYNIQFDGCRPIMIDTLSFERLEADRPWKAYGQFCRHFLAPLALMSKVHIDASYLLRDYIDGIPLDVAARLLPWRSRFSVGLQLHLYLHGRMISKHQATRGRDDEPTAVTESHSRLPKMPKHRLQAYLENLRSTIRSLKSRCGQTQWADYYDDNSYSEDALREKRELVKKYLTSLQPKTVWDLGANTGVFSRIASELGAFTCAFDVDPACVESAYVDGRKHNRRSFLPLRMDLTNPSPALGWAHRERDSLADRGPADAVMALALIHHLAISNNVPLPAIAEYFHKLGRSLIIEFVPKRDPQVRRLLQNREDVFDDYDQTTFERSFTQYFDLREAYPVGTDGRRLYLMQGRTP